MPAQSVASYMADLYHEGNNYIDPILQERIKNLPALVVDKQEIEEAVKALGIKATGNDGMSAKLIKNVKLKDNLINKLHSAINKWFGTARLPKYVNEARLMALSKEDSEYPKVGAIRTISILPQINKVIGKIIDRRIKKEASKHKLIHIMQRGFQSGVSTYTNIDEL